MIRECGLGDVEDMYLVINKAAKVYKGVILPDRYHEPYMPMGELREEIQHMIFFGWEENRRLVGVMGFQPLDDVTLIRHAYVLPGYQGRGLGSKLLEHLKTLTTTSRLLVGTWSDANRAIEFYEKHGFRLAANKDELLRVYWDIPERQIETSVVLGITLRGEYEPTG